jgi:hypothetical protein
MTVTFDQSFTVTLVFYVRFVGFVERGVRSLLLPVSLIRIEGPPCIPSYPSPWYQSATPIKGLVVALGATCARY